jgi:hypothetical protein
MIRNKALDRALERLRKPGAILVLTYTRDTVSGRAFHIWPDGIPVADSLAQKLLERRCAQPLSDGLLPGHPQSWRLGDWRKWRR